MSVNINGTVQKNKRFYQIEPEILDLLQIKLVRGTRSSFDDPGNVFVSEGFEKLRFPEGNALGRLIEINKRQFKITGIVASPPTTTHFKYDILKAIPRSFREGVLEDLSQRWLSNTTLGYLKLKTGEDPALFEYKIKKIADEYCGESLEKIGYSLDYFLRPIEDIHLNANNVHELELPGNFIHIKIALLTGLVILVVFSLNFINFASSHYIRRYKEFFVRGVLNGGIFNQRSQLFIESIASLIFIYVVSLAILLVSTRWFINHQFSENMRLWILLFEGNLWLYSFFYIVFLALVTTIYASLKISLDHLNQFSLKSLNQQFYLRLSIFFPITICLVLIMVSMTVYQQLDFMENAAIGFDKQNKVIIQANFDKEISENRHAYQTTKKAFKESELIRSIAASWSTPGERYTAFFTATPKVQDMLLVNYLLVDEDFIDSYGMEIIVGSEINPQDTIKNVVYSQSALPKLGYKNPIEAIGDIIEIDHFDGTEQVRIVAVIKDFNYRGLQHELEPIGLLFLPEYFRCLSITVDSQRFDESLLHIEQQWKRLDLGNYFDFQILSNQISAHYKPEQNLDFFTKMLALLAIVLTTTGFLNFISINNSDKFKEVGIRKVFGASQYDIYKLISKEYLINMTIAIIVAFPIGYLLMEQWLQSFAFRVHFSPKSFAYSALIVISTLLITSLTQSTKIIFDRPVDAIRYE